MLSAEAIADHLRHLEALGRSEETILKARNSLIRWDRQLPMGILVALPEEIEGLLAEHPSATKATYYDTLVRWFRWLVKSGRIDYDPTADMSRPRVPRRVPRPATDQQVAIACGNAVDPFRLFCRLAAFGGLRCIEIARLDRADICEQDGILLKGKGGHERVVPCPPEVWDLVQLMPPGRIAGGHTPHWVSDATNEYLRRELYLRTSMHRFRAWYATTALSSGADLRTVQELLGHASVATTEVYTYVFDQAKKDAVARMPRLARLTR